MGSSTVRFVHRPISDESLGLAEDGAANREPLIDPNGLRTPANIIKPNESSWLGALFSKLFRAGGGNPRSGGKLDPKRWQPKD